MKVTHFGPDGFPLAHLGNLGGTTISINSNTDTNPPLSSLNFVQRITSNTSNTLLNPIVNFASGSGVSLAAASNTITISASGGSSLPWSYAKADGHLAGDGTTDDTAAFQAWINSVTTSGTKSGWFWFEPGVYLIGGALQDTGAFNGQILLPNVSTSSTQITLTFQGAARPPFAYHGTAVDETYAVIKSTLSGASGTASVISGGNSGQNNIEVVTRNLVCLAPDNPTFTFWNLATTQGGQHDALFISTTSVIAASGISQPTHSNAYGIKLPGTANSNHLAEDLVNVYGFYTGILLGELTFGNFITSLCQVGIEVPTTPHSGGRITHQMTASPFGIKFTGGASYLDIWYDAEHANPPGGAYNPAWAVTTYDVDDGSNYFHGDIEWFGVLAGVGPDHSFTINGGANCSHHEIGALSFSPLTTKGDLYTYSTTNARLAIGSNGTGLIADSNEATGNRWTIQALVGELLMQDGVSAPPVPLESDPGQDDWLYGDM